MFAFLTRVFGRRSSPAVIVSAPSDVRIATAPEVRQEDRITLPISVRARAKAPLSSERRTHGPVFTICYADANGDCSERTVHLYNVPREGADGFRAHCEMRDADRTFKIARILWIEGEHGQRHKPGPYLDALRANQPPRSPRKQIGKVGEVAQ